MQQVLRAPLAKLFSREASGAALANFSRESSGGSLNGSAATPDYHPVEIFKTSDYFD
jgi:hypothetical protein